MVFLLLTDIYAQLFTLSDSICTKISAVNKDLFPLLSNDESFYYLSVSSIKPRKAQIIGIKSNNELVVRDFPKLKKYDRYGLQWATIVGNRLFFKYADALFIADLQKNGKYKIIKQKYYYSQTNELYDKLFAINNSQVILMQDYDRRYNDEDTCGSYSMCVYDVEKEKIVNKKDVYLGRGIALGFNSRYTPLQTNGKHIVLAHPTKPEIYIFNLQLEAIDTIYCSFVTKVNYDSIIHSLLTDEIMKTKNNAQRFNIMTDDKIVEYEKVEKVFFITDDIIGYTIAEKRSLSERTFVLYSISQRKEVFKSIDTFEGHNMPYQFLSSYPVLIKNKKSINYTYYVTNKENYNYMFYLYDMQQDVFNK